MGNEVTDIHEIQAKRLYLEAQKMERDTGVTIEEVLLRIVYESDDDQARVDAIRIYFAVMYNSGLSLDSLIEEQDLAPVLSLRDD